MLENASKTAVRVGLTTQAALLSTGLIVFFIAASVVSFDILLCQTKARISVLA